MRIFGKGRHTGRTHGHGAVAWRGVVAADHPGSMDSLRSVSPD
jgi:hypothetical protein